MEENYLDFGGASYYIDLDALDTILSKDWDLNGKTSEEIDTIETFDNDGKLIEKTISHKTIEKNKELNIATYETVRTFLEILLTFQDEEVDETLGPERALMNASLPFKISFNTLIKYGILKEC